jgi:hypothetical protein
MLGSHGKDESVVPRNSHEKKELVPVPVRQPGISASKGEVE